MAVTFNYGYPAATSVFVPGMDARRTMNVIVDYSRNIKDYLVNKLVTITSVQKPADYWLRFDPAVYSRVNDLNASLFIDGQPFPTGEHNTQRHQFVDYATVRYAEPYYVGYDAKKNAVWDMDAQAENVLGNRMMTHRTLEFFGLVQNANNYLTDNTIAAASVPGGGLWSAATGTNPYIKHALNYAVRTIMKATNSMVRREDLSLLISPTIADAISETQEVREALVRSYWALGEIKGGEPNQNKTWNLPPTLYDIAVYVCPELQNTAQRDKTPNYNFIAGENEAILLARPGQLTNTGGASTAFSSIHMFSYSEWEMVIKVFDEFWNYRYRHECVDARVFKVVSPETMFRFTNVLS